MRCPWTFREFCLRVMGVIFLITLALFFAWNIDESLRRGQGYSEKSMDTRLTDQNCWQWSKQHPESSYNGCQIQFLGGGK